MKDSMKEQHVAAENLIKQSKDQFWVEREHQNFLATRGTAKPEAQPAHPNPQEQRCISRHDSRYSQSLSPTLDRFTSTSTTSST
jgi:hypothetical protein|tara:strand:- start:3408 stop:3659 length:252 start_codon:yes stop_codon:yes gene_type:complete